MKKRIHFNKLAYLSLSLLVSLAFFSPHVNAADCQSTCLKDCRHNSCPGDYSKAGLSGVRNNRVRDTIHKKYCTNYCKQSKFNSTLM